MGRTPTIKDCHPENPIEVLVWDDNEKNKIKRRLIYITENASHPFKVLEESGSTNGYIHAEIIEQPKFRPYKNAEEMKVDLLENCGYVVNEHREIVQILKISDSIFVDDYGYNFVELFEDCKWLKTGKPCGVEID